MRAKAMLSADEYRALVARDAALSKYHNVRTTVDGVTLDSQREAQRYAELLLLEKAGEIRISKVHMRYPLKVNGVLICTYVADFDYVDKDGKETTEDVKGVKTATYRIKKKLMRALYGIEVAEV